MCSENTSGHGEYATIPDEIRGWNWGAFWLSWIWGIFNKSYISLLVFLPILNIIIPFYLGANGNEIAWRNRSWSSIDEFKAEQRKWSIGGWIITILIGLSIVLRFIEINKAEQITANITAQVLNTISENEEASKIIGEKYVIQSEPSLQKISTNQGKFPIAHTMFINGATGLIFIDTSLNRDYTIKEITISLPYENNKIVIRDINE